MSIKIACNYVVKKVQSYVLIEECIRNWDADLLKDLVEQQIKYLKTCVQRECLMQGFKPEYVSFSVQCSTDL